MRPVGSYRTRLGQVPDWGAAIVGRSSPAALAAQFASSAELPDIEPGNRKALNRPLGLAADNAAVDRLVRIPSHRRTAFSAADCRLTDPFGNALGDAFGCERVGADNSEHSKDTRKRESRCQLPRNQKPSPAALIVDGQRLPRDRLRPLVDRFGVVHPFGHALPQLLCEVVAVHAAPGGHLSAACPSLASPDRTRLGQFGGTTDPYPTGSGDVRPMRVSPRVQRVFKMQDEGGTPFSRRGGVSKSENGVPQ